MGNKRRRGGAYVNYYPPNLIGAGSVPGYADENLIAHTEGLAVYLENATGINITGCTFALSDVQLGLNGYKNCRITNNYFLFEDSLVGRHIVEYGRGAYVRNSDTIISNNIFQTPNGNPKIEFYSNTGNVGEAENIKYTHDNQYVLCYDNHETGKNQA